MPFLRQTNFSAGELSPLLWGRTDLDLFGSGLRRMRNFFASREGAAVSRPGTVMVRATKTQFGPLRLVPFIYSDTNSYVLEMGREYIRFHSNGSTITSGGSPVEVTTPYSANELRYLRWVQSGDVMTFTHPRYAPHELTRVSETEWTFEEVDFDREAPVLTEAGLTVRTYGDADDEHVARRWQWRVTEVWKDERGFTYETSPRGPITLDNDGNALPDTLPVYPDMPVELYFQLDPAHESESFVGFRIYRGIGDLFGLVGASDFEGFTDVGDEPDYATPPPKGENPFKVYDSGGTLLRTEYPVCATYFQERLVFGGTLNRPGYVFASVTGDYHNFDRRLVTTADMALLYDLASRRKEEIRHIAGLTRLVVVTASSVWSIGGAGGDPLTPESIDARPQLDVGANHLPLLSVDGDLLFVRAKGTGVYAVRYERDRDGLGGLDAGLQAQHLFLETENELGLVGADTPIVDWCYAEDPWGVVWAVRNDGKLLSLTFREGQSAWALHDTDGFVLSVCSVPETTEDAVYVLVYRPSSGFYVERMASRVERGTTADGMALDSAVRISGAPTDTITGLSHLEGKSVYVTGTGDVPVYGPLTVSGGQVTLPEVPEANDGAETTLYAGLLFEPLLETLDIAQGEARLRQKTVLSVGFEVDNAIGLKVGQDEEHLVEWRQRSPADEYAAVSAATAVVKVAIKGKYDGDARAILKQSAPRWVTVVGLTREVDLGG